MKRMSAETRRRTARIIAVLVIATMILSIAAPFAAGFIGMAIN